MPPSLSGGRYCGYALAFAIPQLKTDVLAHRLQGCYSARLVLPHRAAGVAAMVGAGAEPSLLQEPVGQKVGADRLLVEARGEREDMRNRGERQSP